VVNVRRNDFEQVRLQISEKIRDVPDFPRPGVLFKDITPLLADPETFSATVDAMAAPFAGQVDQVVGIEARGFILAAPIAYRLGAGVIPLRKEGRLPAPTIAEAYELEYGSAVLEVHKDAFQSGRRTLIVDDVLATGGTAAVAASLVEQAGGVVTGMSVLLELSELGGRGRLSDLDLHVLLKF
jgi:adenine phosphoribosyltransferase